MITLIVFMIILAIALIPKQAEAQTYQMSSITFNSPASNDTLWMKENVLDSMFRRVAGVFTFAFLEGERRYVNWMHLQGIPTSTVAYPVRSLNTVFQLSTTRDMSVSYTVDITCTATITGGQEGTVILEYADDIGITTNVKTVQSSANGNTGTIIGSITLVQKSTASLTGVIPTGKYARIRTVNTTGTPSFAYRSSQETQY